MIIHTIATDAPSELILSDGAVESISTEETTIAKPKGKNYKLRDLDLTEGAEYGIVYSKMLDKQNAVAFLQRHGFASADDVVFARLSITQGKK